MERYQILLSLGLIFMICTDFTEACAAHHWNNSLASSFWNCKPLQDASEQLFDSLQSVVDYVIRDSYWFKITSEHTCSGKRNKPDCWIFALYFLLDHRSPLFVPTSYCICDYAKTCWTPPKWNRIEMENSILRNSRLYKAKLNKDAKAEKVCKCIDDNALAYIRKYPSLKGVDGCSISTFLKHHYTYCRHLPHFPYELHSIFEIIFLKKVCPRTEQSRNVFAVLTTATRRDGPIWHSIKRCMAKGTKPPKCHYSYKVVISQGKKFWNVTSNGKISVVSTSPSPFFIEFLNSDSDEPRIAIRTPDKRYLTYSSRGYVEFNSTKKPKTNQLIEFILGTNGGYVFRLPNTMASLREVSGTVWASSGKYEWNVAGNTDRATTNQPIQPQHGFSAPVHFARDRRSATIEPEKTFDLSCITHSVLRITDEQQNFSSWSNDMPGLPSIATVIRFNGFDESIRWRLPVDYDPARMEIRSYVDDLYYVTYQDGSFRQSVDDSSFIAMDHGFGDTSNTCLNCHVNGQDVYIGHSVPGVYGYFGELITADRYTATEWTLHVLGFCCESECDCSSKYD